MQTARARYHYGNTPTMELLRPISRRSPARPARPLNEIEDAVFEKVEPETAGTDCVYGAPEGMFVPHVRSDGRISHGYRQSKLDAVSPLGRLDLFSARSLPPTTMQPSPSPIVRPAFLISSVVVAAAIFWMVGGHVFLAGTDDSSDSLMTATVPIETLLQTGSVSPFENDGPARVDQPPRAGGSHPVGSLQKRSGQVKLVSPPARIERAGSILMIRSGS